MNKALLSFFVVILTLSVSSVYAKISYTPAKAVDLSSSPGKINHCFNDVCAEWEVEVSYNNGSKEKDISKKFFKEKQTDSSSVWGLNDLSNVDYIDIKTDKGKFYLELDLDEYEIWYIVWKDGNTDVDFYDLALKNPTIDYELMNVGHTKVRFYNIIDFDPITYSSPTVTVAGSGGTCDSFSNCCNMSGVYDAVSDTSKVDRFIGTGQNISWFLNQTKIVINSGAYFCIDHESITVDYATSANTIIFDTSGDMLVNSSALIFDTSVISTNVLWPFRVRAGTTEIYTSQIIGNSDTEQKMRAVYGSGGTTWINGTNIVGTQTGIQALNGDVIITDSTIVNARTPIILQTTPSVEWSNIILKDSERGYTTHRFDSKVYNLKVVNCGDPVNSHTCWDGTQSGVGTPTHYIVDSDIWNWSSVELNVDGRLKYQAHTFNVKVKESGVLESPLSSVNVTLYDSSGNSVFSSTTVADGTIAEQEVNFRKWIYTGSVPVAVDTEYYPFNLVLTKSGYQTVNLSLNYSVIEGRELEGIDLEIAMLESVASGGGGSGGPPAKMYYFIFWNLVLFTLTFVIIKSKDFTVIAVCFFITIWAAFTWVVTQPYELQGVLVNTTEYVDASNQTITDYTRENFAIPQNFLDVVYVIFIAVLALYAARKLLLSEQGGQIRKKFKELW